MYYNPPVERLDGVQVIKEVGLKFGPQTMGELLIITLEDLVKFLMVL